MFAPATLGLRQIRAAACLCFLLTAASQGWAGEIPAKLTAEAVGAAARGAKSGDVIVLPEGTYSGTIDLPAGVSLRGAGCDKTFLDAGTADAGIRIAGGMGAVVEDLSLRTRGASGIEAAGTEGLTLRRIKIRGGCTGVRISRSSAARVENVVVDQAFTGISLTGANKSCVVNCTMYRCNSACLSLVDVENSAVFNNILADTGIGVTISGKREGLALDYNLYLPLYVGKIEGLEARVSLGTWRSVSGLDAHSVQLAVEFVDADRGDYAAKAALEWAPWRATTSDWGASELAGMKAPAKDIAGRDRTGGFDVGTVQTPPLAEARPDGQFQISCDDGVKSAGIFRKDGTAVRYLFQSLPLKKGVYGLVLPSRDTLGGAIEAGDYEIRVAEGLLRSKYRGLVGNNGTASGPLGADLDSVRNVRFAPDGGLLLACGWSERGSNLMLRDLKTRMGKWMLRGQSENAGLAVTGDGKALLLRPYKGGYTLVQVNPADGLPVPYGPDQPLTRLESNEASIHGLAEMAGKLFLADTGGRIFITSAREPRFSSSVEVPGPANPVADPAHKLVWVVSNHEKVLALDAEGKVIVEFTAVAVPIGVATNGRQLAVASQVTGKIHLFDISDPGHPKAAGTIGTGDGPYGPIRPDRFWFQKGPYAESPRDVSMDMDANGRLAVVDDARHVVAFDEKGQAIYHGFSHFGNAPFRAYFADNGDRVRFFDNSGSFSWFIDANSGTWALDAYWGKPPLNQSGGNPPVHFFSAGGKNFGAFFYTVPGGAKPPRTGTLIVRYDNYVGRPVALYTNLKDGAAVIRDTNGDGIIDLSDGNGTLLKDADGKPLKAAVNGRWIAAMGQAGIHNGGGQVWKLKGLDAEGNPDFEFPAAPLVLAKPVQSPYDPNQKANLAGQSESEVALDGEFIASIQAVSGAPNGMGLSNTGAIDLARFRKDGALRWYLPMNDYCPLQGIKTAERFLLTSP